MEYSLGKKESGIPYSRIHELGFPFSSSRPKRAPATPLTSPPSKRVRPAATRFVSIGDNLKDGYSRKKRRDGGGKNLV